MQPHSGIDANLVAFWAILARRVERPFLDAAGVGHVNDLDGRAWRSCVASSASSGCSGMSLDAGGHLTHGFRPNISGKMFDQSSYGVDPETGLIDYDAHRHPGPPGSGPLILVAGYSAYPRRIDFARLAQIAAEVDATFMVDMAHFAGLVAGKVFTGDHDPVPHADVVTTTTHKSLRGPRGGMVLSKADYAEYVEKGVPWCSGAPCQRHGGQGGRAWPRPAAPTSPTTPGHRR